MNLNSRVSKLEKIQQASEPLVIVTCIPDWNDPNYIIVQRSDRQENERITLEEHRRRIAEDKANGIPIYGIPISEEEELP